MLVRTDELALFVHSGRAYTRGFEFALGLHTQEPRERRDCRIDDGLARRAPRRSSTTSCSASASPTQTAGRRPSSIRVRGGGDPERPETPDIVLMQRGGGGGGASWDFRFWAWPLPPDGPLEFVAEWPSEGIELTRAEVDSAVVREAAARAVTLWPNGDATWPLGNLDALRVSNRLLLTSARELVQGDRAGRRDVQRLGSLDRDRRLDVARNRGIKPFALRAEQEGDAAGQVDARQVRSAVRDERDARRCL